MKCQKPEGYYREARSRFEKEIRATLCKKETDARHLLYDQHRKFGDKMVLASSFGKDSTVLLHQALKVNPDIRVVFNNTGVEFKESLDHRDLLVDLWNINLIEIKPPRTFFNIAREYGLPDQSRWGQTREPKCCQILKTKPMRDWIIENGAEAIIVGILGSESYARLFASLRDGQIYYAKSFWKCWKVHPLLYWTEDDIWEYHERHELPINAAYEKYNIKRTGCAPCTNHKEWERQVREWNPKLYKIIQEMRGQALLDVEG